MVQAKKHLGQHFLKNLDIAKNISDAISSDFEGDILEIGPGMGVLTQFLIKKNNQIFALDIDKESIDYLNKNYSESSNLKIIEADFLRINLEEMSKKEIAIIGNFPYNISSQILFKILEYKPKIPEMVGMFQKEVAERVVAKHGNKTYGILSVLIQAYFKTDYLFTVDENEFNPPPRVKSAVIKLTKYRNTIGNDALLHQIVKTGFGQRRKKLSNALKSLIIPEHIQNHSFMDLRAEQLSVENFIELTAIWK